MTLIEEETSTPLFLLRSLLLVTFGGMQAALRDRHFQRKSDMTLCNQQ